MMNRWALTALALAMVFAARAQKPLGTAAMMSAPPPSIDLLALPPAYSYERLGLFCKLDVQLEKRLLMPVRFRLGEARLVDAWEGKGPLALPLGQ